MTETPFPFPRSFRSTEVLVGTGVTEYGPFGFKIFDDVDVKVFVKEEGQRLFEETAVAVQKVEGEPFDDFTIAFADPVPSTTQFIVFSARLHERQIAVTKGGAISPVQLEKELSKQGTVLDELRRDINRAPKPDYGEPRITIENIPEGNFWKRDADGNMVDGGSAEDIEDAQGYAAAAEAALNDFEDRYLGPYPDDAAATEAAEGEPILGALYWNTTTEQLRVWDGSVWEAGGIGDMRRSVYDPQNIEKSAFLGPINVKWHEVVGDGDADDTAALAAVVQLALSEGRPLYADCDILTTASIPNLHDVRWQGPGRILRGGDVWHITPPDYDTINHIYVAASGGDAANDGLSSSDPLDTFNHAIDALEKWAPLSRGQWKISLDEGTHAGGRFPDEGLIAAYPIIVAGPAVSATAGFTVKFCLEGVSGTFQA